MNLQELLGQRAVEHDDDCGIERVISQQREVLQSVPGESAPDAEVVAWARGRLESVAAEATKQARKAELQLELHLLDAPEGIDFESDDETHTKLHLDHDQMNIEIQRRQGAAWRRFIEIVGEG